MSRVVPMSMVIRIARVTAATAVLIAAACLPSPPASRSGASANSCDGEPYLDIVNRSERGANLYASINGQRKYLGTVGPTDTRFSLVGTAAEHASGQFGEAWRGYAVPIDPDPNTRGGPNDPLISVTLQCDRSIKP